MSDVHLCIYTCAYMRWQSVSGDWYDIFLTLAVFQGSS